MAVWAVVWEVAGAVRQAAWVAVAGAALVVVAMRVVVVQEEVGNGHFYKSKLRRDALLGAVLLPHKNNVLYIMYIPRRYFLFAPRLT